MIFIYLIIGQLQAHQIRFVHTERSVKSNKFDNLPYSPKILLSEIVYQNIFRSYMFQLSNKIIRIATALQLSLKGDGSLVFTSRGLAAAVETEHQRTIRPLQEREAERRQKNTFKTLPIRVRS